MEDLDVDVVETEWLEDQILTLFEGKRDFIIMSALTMVAAKVIVSQKSKIPTLDVEHVLDLTDEQLRYTVLGVLDMLKRSKGEN